MPAMLLPATVIVPEVVTGPLTVITSEEVDEAAEPAVSVMAPLPALMPAAPMVSGLCALITISPPKVDTAVVASVVNAPLLRMATPPPIEFTAFRLLTWVLIGTAAVPIPL